MTPRGQHATHRPAVRRVRWFVVSALLVVVTLLGLLPVSVVRAASQDEMRVHAAYVLNFVRYSQWPAPGDGPIVVTVLGTAPDATVLRELAARAGTIQGRPLSVRLLSLASIPPEHSSAVRAIAGATAGSHVLYVGSSHRAWSRAVGAAAAARPLLTVGPGPGFVAAGGMFGLYLDGGHVRFAINAPAIKASPVVVSARLISLARPGPGG